MTESEFVKQEGERLSLIVSEAVANKIIDKDCKLTEEQRHAIALVSGCKFKVVTDHNGSRLDVIGKISINWNGEKFQVYQLKESQ